MHATITALKEEVDGKVETIKRLEAEIENKGYITRDLQAEAQELRERLSCAFLAAKQEGIRRAFDWQAKLTFKKS